MLVPLMRARSRHNRQSAFTLIEVMVVIALVAIVVSLAGPSFREYMLMQRLRGVHSQLVTDVNYARSEAVSRGVTVQVKFQAGTGLTCYVIYTGASDPCDCTAPVGSRCTSAPSEIKTVVAPTGEGVAFWVSTMPATLTISPRTGGPDIPPLSEGVIPPDFTAETRLVDASRRMRVAVSTAGRVQVCSPSGTVAGMPSC